MIELGFVCVPLWMYDMSVSIGIPGWAFSWTRIHIGIDIAIPRFRLHSALFEGNIMNGIDKEFLAVKWHRSQMFTLVWNLHRQSHLLMVWNKIWFYFFFQSIQRRKPFNEESNWIPTELLHIVGRRLFESLNICVDIRWAYCRLSSERFHQQIAETLESNLDRRTRTECWVGLNVIGVNANLNQLRQIPRHRTGRHKRSNLQNWIVVSADRSCARQIFQYWAERSS